MQSNDLEINRSANVESGSLATIIYEAFSGDDVTQQFEEVSLAKQGVSETVMPGKL